MAGRARGGDRLRRAARALGGRAVRVLPEPERDADRVRPGAQERDRAVDAAAHRDGDPSRRGLRDEDLAERGRERLDGERLAADRRRFEQRQTGERRASSPSARPRRRCARRPRRGGRRPLAAARRVPRTSLAPSGQARRDAARLAPAKVLHPADDAPTVRNLALPGGCRAGRRQRLSPTPAPFTCLLVHVWAGATYRVEPPSDIASRSLRGVVTARSVAKRHSISVVPSSSSMLGERPRSPRAAGRASTSALSITSDSTCVSSRRSTSFAPHGSTGWVTPSDSDDEHLAARRPLGVARRPARAREGRVPARRGHRAGQPRSRVGLRAARRCERERAAEQRDGAEQDEPLRERVRHAPSVADAAATLAA